MKFTLSWLRDHLDTKATLEEITTRLTANGLLVDSVENPAETLKGFKIVEILEAHPHPNADRLKVCRVNTGTDIVQIVCGAPNARAGLKGIFASPGTTIPTSGLVLGKSKIRDVESAGMMCSERELGFGDSHEGIIELPPDAPVGEDFCVYKGLDDPVIDIEITPNRGDCLGVRGIARDLAATGIGDLKPLKIPSLKGQFSSSFQVRIDDLQGCPFFTGRLIRNVRNSPSPEWLQKKLRAIGLKPISALVDITNFMSYDRGRPMHVFDADKLQGSLTIRKARTGDQLQALDNNTYLVPSDALVITDEHGVCSLAGIMGGLASGCSEETVNVFVESALFEPVRIAMAGRALGILSDSRYRFERGVDPAIIEEGLEQATQMILDFCGGEASNIIRAGVAPSEHHTVPFHTSRVQTLGGLSLPKEKIYEILERLGFMPEGEHTFKVPSWRPDIKGEADLVEEILRIHGYDAVEAVDLPRITPEEIRQNPESQIDRPWKIRRSLVSREMSEAYTWSFIKKGWAEKFGGGDSLLAVENPISADMSDMRPSLLPLLLDALRRNIARGHKELALFEIGNQYHVAGEVLAATGIRGLETGPRHWLNSGRLVDLFDAKADVYAVLESCGFDPSALQLSTETPPWYHPGRSGTLMLGAKTKVAYFGEFHPQILEMFDLQEPVVGFEVFVNTIPAAKGLKKDLPLLSPYQPVERDFSFILDTHIPGEKLLQLIQKLDKNLITSVSVFDVYQGKGVPEGKKSVALSVRLEPRENTLTEAEITNLSNKIIENAQKILGAELRS